MSIRNLLEVLDDWLGKIAICLIVVITICAVFMRYVLNDPLQWVEEVLIILYIWAIMLGATSAMKAEQHVSIDAFTTLLPVKVQGYLRVLNHVLCIIILGAFGVLGFQLAMEAGEKITPILGLKYTYVDIAVPVGAFWMVIHLVRLLLRDLKKICKES